MVNILDALKNLVAQIEGMKKNLDIPALGISSGMDGIDLAEAKQAIAEQEERNSPYHGISNKWEVHEGQFGSDGLISSSAVTNGFDTRDEAWKYILKEFRESSMN